MEKKQRTYLKDKEMGWFLRGPIDLLTLTPVAYMKGKSLNVYLAILFIAFMEGDKNIKIPKRIYSKFGLNRQSMYRGLAELEREEFVSVKRRRGVSSLITLINLGPKTKKILQGIEPRRRVRGFGGKK